MLSTTSCDRPWSTLGYDGIERATGKTYSLPGRSVRMGGGHMRVCKRRCMPPRARSQLDAYGMWVRRERGLEAGFETGSSVRPKFGPRESLPRGGGRSIVLGVGGHRPLLSADLGEGDQRSGGSARGLEKHRPPRPHPSRCDL